MAVRPSSVTVAVKPATGLKTFIDAIGCLLFQKQLILQETWLVKYGHKPAKMKFRTPRLWRSTSSAIDRLSPARSQFDRLDIGYAPSFDPETKDSSDEMPSLMAAGTRIHMK
jgi:hypothetical protein